MSSDRGITARRLAYEASVVTSTATIRQAIRNPQAGVDHPLTALRSEGVVRRGMTVQTALRSVSKWMLSNYRSEGVYKNAIANKIFLHKHSWNRASMLGEFKIAGSVADAVVVNGHGTVYEIKSELDNPAKLHKQICDYRRAFRAVYVVTHRSLVKDYLQATSHLPSGVIALSDDGSLRVRRRATLDPTDLNTPTMMRSLRKPEYTRIAETILGGEIDVAPIHHFAACAHLAASVSPAEYSVLFEEQLRARRPRAGAAITDGRFYDLLDQLLKVDPSTAQLDRLATWLGRKA